MSVKRAVAAGMAILLMLLFGGCASGYGETIEANWGITLPDGYEQAYQADTGASFHGDGVRYHVLSYPEEMEFEGIKWGAVSQETLFAGSALEAAQDFLAQLEIDEAWNIPYERCVAYHQSQEDNSELLLFWDEEDAVLYIVESFL